MPTHPRAVRACLLLLLSCACSAKHRDTTLQVWQELLLSILPARVDASCWLLETLAARTDTLFLFLVACPVVAVRAALAAVCLAALKVRPRPSAHGWTLISLCCAACKLGFP